VVVAAVGAVGGVVQVVIGDGDGWVRSYEASSGKKLWSSTPTPRTPRGRRRAMKLSRPR